MYRWNVTFSMLCRRRWRCCCSLVVCVCRWFFFVYFVFSQWFVIFSFRFLSTWWSFSSRVLTVLSFSYKTAGKRHVSNAFLGFSFISVKRQRNETRNCFISNHLSFLRLLVIVVVIWCCCCCCRCCCCYCGWYRSYAVIFLHF